jgi:hypothetical protein
MADFTITKITYNGATSWAVCGGGVCVEHPQLWQAQVLHHAKTREFSRENPGPSAIGTLW